MYTARKLLPDFPISGPIEPDWSPIWTLKRVGKLSDAKLAALLYRLVPLGLVDLDIRPYINN